MKKKLSLFMTFALLFSACAGTASAASPANNAKKENVITMTVPSDYDYVYDRLNEVFGAHVEMEAPVEEVLPLVQPDVEIVKESGVTEAPVMEAPAEAVVEEAVVEESAAAPQTGTGDSGDYSGTNVQVEGIDEGDIVKTDGEYIYVLKQSTDELVILAADGAETRVLSRKQTNAGYTITPDNYRNRTKHTGDYRYESLEEDPTEFYLYGDYAAVLLSCYSGIETRTGGVYQYTSEEYTLVKIYDVSDPAAPLHIASLGQSGNCETSRMIGGKLYLLTEHRFSLGEREDRDSYIPSLYTTGKKELVPANTILCPPEITSKQYTVLSEFSIAEQKITATKSVLTQTDTVYMSGEHIYLADEYAYTDVLDEYKESVYTVMESVSGRRTDLYKFGIGEKITVKAFCTVDGELLNQFSMDEYNGNLRVVTTHQASSRKIYEDREMGFTNSRWISSGQTSGLYVYDENLNLLGSVTGLAEEERVYSVRFDGDVGYFVTFRETDPLFAVNLSDPKNPTIMSALKIPGFSEYLHPYSDDLLFGLGQDATLTGWTTGMKLSMFDVSDPYDVVERDKLTLDISYSTALNNHKAILISPERGIIGFPSDAGYVIYGYSEKEGFCEIVRTDFGLKWNRNARGLYIGDMLYIVMQECTVVMDMVNYDIQATVKY